jgi:hypothetical protein
VRRSAGLAEVFVQLRPVDASNAQWTIAAGPDGSFRFDRIAPGTYLVWGGVERGSRLGGTDSAGKRGEVRSGQVLEIDLDLDPGDITVGLRIGGDDVQFGYGVIAREPAGMTDDALPRNVDEGRRMILRSDTLDIREGMIVDDRRIEFTGVKAGRYLACIAPLHGDPSDPAVVAEMNQGIVDWPLSCERVTFTATPKRQEITVEVAALPR